MNGLKLVTAPAATPISLDTAKAHLRVDHSDDDEMIVEMIEQAADYIDGYRGVLGRAVITQTWDLFLDAWPCEDNGYIKVPLPPLQSVTFLKYRNSAGVWTSLVANTDFEVDTNQTFGWIIPLNGWPFSLYDKGLSKVNVRFVAGYGDDEFDMPPLVRHIVKTMIGDSYENRESFVTGQTFTETPAVKRALALLRVIGV